MTRAQYLLTSSRRVEVETPSRLDHLNALSEALEFYLAKQLSKEDFTALSQKVNQATTHWLHQFLRLPGSTRGYYRSTKQRARILVAKMALQRHYPLYHNEGFHAFSNSTPLIFASRSWFWLEELRFDLGLPLKSIYVFGDIKHLESLIEEFLAPDSCYRPVMLVGSSGGWREDFKGDDVVNIVKIAQKYKLWCHIEGNAIFRLAAPPGLNKGKEELLEAIINADSILLNALSLIGFPDDNKFLSSVFYKTAEKPYPSPESSIPPPPESPLIKPEYGALTLQLWFALQYLGKEQIIQKISKSIELTEILYSALCKIPSVHVVSPPHSLVVAFQCVPVSEKNPSDANFIEKLNQQIFQDLLHTLSSLDIELIHHKGSLDLFLFNPFFSSSIGKIEQEHITLFTETLKEELELIEASISLKQYFQELVIKNSEKGLFNVQTSNPLSIGALKYIPPLLLTGPLPVSTNPSSPIALGSKLQNQIDKLNEMLAAKLNSENKVFRKDTDVHEKPCISVGIDKSILKEITITNANPNVPQLPLPQETEPKTEGEEGETLTITHTILVHKDTTKEILQRSCEAYVYNILQTAAQVENEFDFSKEIGKIVESGIKEAEERLKKEQERLESQQGIIRKIPIVGNVLNWWSPVEVASKGNSFSLLTTEVYEPKNLKRSPIKKPSFEAPPEVGEQFKQMSANLKESLQENTQNQSQNIPDEDSNPPPPTQPPPSPPKHNQN
eukprot:TRINITY_DN3258_c0_g3_i1.p1 TRINITY_DN3258_c0_g3~~TRINITY_DN3258_c0_g3_i1.p1  ORF type:complete len:729 (-),score=184.24 TRINITY_DN3258_c0_g3_i1:2-2188(-)